MKKYKYISIILLILLSVLPNVAFTAPSSSSNEKMSTSVYVFDMSIIMSSKAIVSIDEQIKKFHEEWNKKVAEESNELKKEYESVNDDSYLLSEEAKEKKKYDLNNKISAAQAKWKQRDLKLRENINNINNSISEMIKDIITKIAQERHIDIIIAKPPFQPSYSSPDYDLTNVISSRLSKELANFSIDKYMKF